MKAAQLILCDERCPGTGRYCRGIFFHQKFFDRHMLARKHNFPRGLRARDRLVLAASKPGGLVYNESRPNRASNNVTFGIIHEAVEGSPGEIDAQCLVDLTFLKYSRCFTISSQSSEPTKCVKE
jgi:hypothetical protein